MAVSVVVKRKKNVVLVSYECSTTLRCSRVNEIESAARHYVLREAAQPFRLAD